MEIAQHIFWWWKKKGKKGIKGRKKRKEEKKGRKEKQQGPVKLKYPEENCVTTPVKKLADEVS